ncbi:MAG: ArnT family glycosyltransferase [Caldilineaceae bacterium]
MNQRARVANWILMVAIAVPFVVLATFYSLHTPAWETPDEYWHFAYAAYLRETHSIPVTGVTQIASAQHPPLYYALISVLTSPFDLSGWTELQFNPNFMHHGGSDINAAVHTSNETFPYHGTTLALHAGRLVSVAIGTATVLLVLLTGWLIFPQARAIGFLAAALVAFNPQFLFISSSVNPDNLLAMAIAGMLWQIVRTLPRPDSLLDWLYVGIWIAVGTLTKVNGLLFAVIAASMLGICAWRSRSWSLLLRGGIALLIPIATLTGWWFVRNQILYGDPTGWSAYTHFATNILRETPVTFADLREFFAIQLRSYWGVFGWLNVEAPKWFYNSIKVLYAAAAAGLLVFAIRDLGKTTENQRLSLTAGGLMILAHEAYMVRYLVYFGGAWNQGRYIFPLLSPIALFLSLGLLSLVPRRFSPAMAGSITCVLLGVAIYMPLAVITPAYDIVPEPKWTLWSAQHRTGYEFGEMIALPKYEVHTKQDQVDLRLFWRALRTPDFDYTAFVHVLDREGNIVAQLDRVPGESRQFLPSSWAPGDIVADFREVPVAGDAKPAQIRLGFYNWETGERLPVTEGGQLIGDSVLLEVEQ